MPNQRWEVVLIDHTGRKIASVLDIDAENAKKFADTWNDIHDNLLSNATKRPSRWVAQPKEPTSWNPH